MAELKNTCIDFKFEDGDSVKMTLAFYLLYQLKTKNKNVYDDYNKIVSIGVKEELDMIVVLYTAYLCANIDDIAGCMSFDDFIVKCGSDRITVRRTVNMLMQPKKQ